MTRKSDSTRQRRGLSLEKLLIIATGVVIISCACVSVSTLFVPLWSAVNAVQSDLVALESLAAGNVQELDVGEAYQMLRTTRADLIALDRATKPLLWMAPLLGWLPRYGPDIQAAPVLLEIGLELTAAGDQLVAPLLPLLEPEVAPSGSPDTDTQLSEALSVLEAGRPQLVAALASVGRAQAARERLDAKELSPRVQGWVARLDRYLPLLEPGIKGALVLPEALGGNGRRTYLLLVQNEDELRATGGFISGVARVTVENGELVDLAFEDSYAIYDASKPYPAPPAPLLEYMLSGLWLFWDANWSPDFPTSAQAAADLYGVSHDGEIDGVVALDQQAIRLLVGALAPLPVEGQAKPVTGGNVIPLAHQAWNPEGEVTGEWWLHRKDFMGAVMTAALARVDQGLTRTDLAHMARALLQALEEKHVLVYLEDEAAAALLGGLGWDGSLVASPGDYLMVVDSNLGFNKANALVQESLEYTLDLSDLGQPRATLVVRHQHLGAARPDPCVHKPRYDATYEQMMERCYWDYLRVYVPGGSQLLSATPHAVPGDALLTGVPSPARVTVERAEHGRDVFATFFLLRPGETVETRFEYALPKDVVRVEGQEAEYILRVQKQPGTEGIPLQVRVLLPSTMQLDTSEPGASAALGPWLEYALTLERDRTLSLSLSSAP